MMDLFHKDTGSGPVILFLHGLCESHKVWDAVSGELSKTYRLLVPDLPGFGNSKPLPQPFSTSQVAHAVLKWLNGLTRDRVLLVGHSLGGYIALEMMQAQPESFAGIVLFQSTAYADSAEKKTARENSIKEIAEQGVPAFVSAFIPKLFLDPGHPEIRSLIDDAKNIEADTLSGYIRAMQQRPDRTNVLKTFNERVLLLGGTEDIFVPVGVLKAQQKLGSRIGCRVLEGSVHMGMIENVPKSSDLLQKVAKKCHFNDFGVAPPK